MRHIEAYHCFEWNFLKRAERLLFGSGGLQLDAVEKVTQAGVGLRSHACEVTQLATERSGRLAGTARYFIARFWR